MIPLYAETTTGSIKLREYIETTYLPLGFRIRGGSMMTLSLYNLQREALEFHGPC